MTKIPMIAFCAAALAACAGTQTESKLDRHVTRIDDDKPGTAKRAGDAPEPSDPQEPAAPRVDITLPGPDWMMKRDVALDPSVPPVAVMLINIPGKASVFLMLFPSSLGTPKSMAEQQRAVLVKSGTTCGKVIASKDGKQAGFVTQMKRDDGETRKGKVTFMLRDNHKEVTIVMFGAWDPASDKAMSADMDKAAASATLK